MVNYSKKIAQALTTIRKYYGAINVQRTDNENVVYLFDYTHNKKTIGSERIADAVNKAMKQQDFPKDIFYSNGMLSVVNDTVKIEENVQQPETIETIEADETIEAEEVKPKKRGRKKQTEIDAES